MLGLFFNFLLSAMLALTPAPASPIQAQVDASLLPPCPYEEIDPAKYGNQPFQNPPDERSKQGQLETTLTVQYTDPSKTSIGGCPVKLRSYNGQLIGPTLRLKSGENISISLDNQLPIESPDEKTQQVAQEASAAFIDTLPNSFNTTNFHTHGLHVSPVGNSDNVLIAIPPQTQIPVEISVPTNHPSGTFWYHAHAHGSTAVQVGSSMAGAIIIEDDETQLPPSLKAANEHEKVLVFQTILYDAEGQVEDISSFFPNSTPNDACQKNLPSCTWDNSKRRITINGEIVPIIKMHPGEVQRWRMIDAAFRESITVSLEGHNLNEIALDGIYLNQIDSWTPNQPIDLEPGYRSDVLVKASSKPGTYRLIDTSAPQAKTNAQASSSTRRLGTNSFISSGIHTTLRGVPEQENLLALVIIEGESMDMQLPTSAEIAKLNPFQGVDLQAQADGVQEVIFKIGSAAQSSDSRNYFQVNYAAFNPNRVRQVQLGATDMWNLNTIGDPNGAGGIPPLPHVFHIHINPFQTTRQDPAGNKEVVWKDTLLVPSATPLQIYTQYLDYIGEFVMHCHILDHEDLGMMEVVKIVN